MNYPLKAQELSNSEHHGGDKFFFLCQVGEGGSVPKITIDGDYPIAVSKEELRGEIHRAQNVKLPSRYEVTNGPIPNDLTNTSIDWARMRTAATGLALWISSKELPESMIYLVQNSADKPVNASRWNFPSNLMRASMLEQAFQAANSETGLLIPRKDGKGLVGVNFALPETFPGISEGFQAAVLSAREQQESNIRKQLAEKYPEFQDKPIKWQTAQTVERNDSPMREVEINLLGKVFKTRAHMLDDPKAHSANVHFPVTVNLDALDGASNLDFNNVMAIDPEKFGRNHGLFTREEAGQLDTIPAPNDYFQRLNV